jgi:hypothetical protein
MGVLAHLGAFGKPNEPGLHGWSAVIVAVVGTHAQTAAERELCATVLVTNGAHLPRLATPEALASFERDDLGSMIARSRRHAVARVRLSAWAWRSEHEGRVCRLPVTGIAPDDRAWAAAGLRKKHWFSWPLRQEAIARL